MPDVTPDPTATVVPIDDSGQPTSHVATDGVLTVMCDTSGAGSSSPPVSGNAGNTDNAGEALSEKSTSVPGGKRRFSAKHLSLLPNICTSMNLFCGYLSIVLTAQQEFLIAAWLIVLANIFDILDGRIARLTSVTSRFGAELDSLADLVSFGVAPAFLVYIRYMSDTPVLGFIATSVFVLCGALRLARFNITPPSDRDVFIGLPIPAAAGILFTLTIFEMQFFQFFRFPDVLIPWVVLLTAYLMVSNIEYPAMKKSKKTTGKRRWMALLLLVGLVFNPPVTLFLLSWGFAAYGLLISLLFKLLRLPKWLSPRRTKPEPTPSAPPLS